MTTKKRLNHVTDQHAHCKQLFFWTTSMVFVHTFNPSDNPIPLFPSILAVLLHKRVNRKASSHFFQKLASNIVHTSWPCYFSQKRWHAPSTCSQPVELSASSRFALKFTRGNAGRITVQLAATKILLLCQPRRAGKVSSRKMLDTFVLKFQY